MPFNLDHVDTVVLAGGINSTTLFEGNTPGYKALLEFGGKPSICYTLEALRALPQIGRVCIVGAEAALRPAVAAHDDDSVNYDFVPSGETLIDSIYRGVGHFPDAAMVLIVTADAPLLTTKAIRDFLDACAPVETSFAQNLCLSVVPQRSFTGVYATLPKGPNRFRDVTINYGSLMLVDPHLQENTKATRRINSLFNHRENPISSALGIGMHVGLTYVLGIHLWHLLTIEQMAGIASSRFGIGLIPISLNHPEITIDVDEPADYEFVKQQLSPEAEQ